METFSILGEIRRSMEIYEIVCKPVCEELQMPLPALDILMTLADHPCYTTAKEISDFKAIKPNLISVYVEKLAKAGFIERQTVEGNRRSIKLSCTEKALPIIEHGRKRQELYLSLLSEGLSDEDIGHFKRIAGKINENAEAIKKRAKDGTLELDC